MKKSYTHKIAYYDETGRRRGKTFSAPTKREARAKAQEWMINHSDMESPSMTVLRAVDGYIELRSPVLSPVTSKQYRSIRNTHIAPDSIAKVMLSELTTPIVQAWVNSLIEKVSPKTVKNCYALLYSSIKMYRKIDLDIRLPRSVKYQGHTPGDDEVRTLIQRAKDTDRNLYLACLLGAFGPMRRSELCALDASDVHGAAVTVSKAKVPVTGGGWVIKDTPKTDASNRTIIFPDFVAEELKGIEGPIITCSPAHITKAFKKQVKAAGLPEFRFHDLRHYSASMMMYLGISTKGIEARGGWNTNSPVLRKLYMDKIEAENRRETDLINAHFSSIL